MSYSRREEPGGSPPQPPQSPYPPRPPRRGEGWTAGTFSPAIFLVALLVIGFLVAAAVLSQREEATPTPAPGGATSAATSTTGSAGAPTLTGTPRTFVVANTGGEGVYLRRTPRLADRDTAYPEGTRLVAIGADVDGEGGRWHHVRTPDGKSGYVPARYANEAAR